MKHLLATIAIALTVAMYLPLWVRLCSRRTSGDHSKWTWWGVMALQLLGTTIAFLDGAKTLYSFYYPMQILVVGITLYLVYRFYD